MQSSLGHEATDNNQMTPKHLFHLVTGHYEKLLPLGEFPLSSSYRWPWSSSAHVECRLFFGPLHHLLLSNIWRDAFWPYTDEGNKSSFLSCENRTTFLRGWQIKEVKKYALLDKAIVKDKGCIDPVPVLQIHFKIKHHPWHPHSMYMYMHPGLNYSSSHDLTECFSLTFFKKSSKLAPCFIKASTLA